ncbi:MAG: substrate-binding domain-containing protein, partial [Aestuariivirgaceae bacterium]
MEPPSELVWPAERAKPLTGDAGNLTIAGSNVVLDLHGDPVRARLVVFSDGNHHMALQETLSRFLDSHPAADDIFYATTPPRIIIDALKSGAVHSGNVSISVRPHVFISPGDILEQLASDGLVGRHKPFMRSSGLSLLMRKDRRAGIDQPADVLMGDVRLAISNPVTEKASFTFYRDALV